MMRLCFAVLAVSSARGFAPQSMFTKTASTAATPSAISLRRSVALANGPVGDLARPGLSRLEPLGTSRNRQDNRGPDFEPNLGKVIDTLRTDYAHLFTEPLDYSIYDKDVTVKDPTGVVLKGLRTYRRLFAALRFFRSTLMDSAETRFRVTYDWAEQRVRVNWHMTLTFKAGQGRPVFVDCISMYKINNEGFVQAHVLETIVVNGTPVEPPFAYAWINLDPWLTGDRQPGRVAAPTLRASTDLALDFTDLQFDAVDSKEMAHIYPTLFDGVMPTSPTHSSSAASGPHPELRDVLEDGTLTTVASSLRKTAADAKRAQQSAQQEAALKNPALATVMKDAADKVSSKVASWLPRIDIQGCEDSFDCDAPMVCCDMVFAKVCCNSGMGSRVSEPLMEPIPVPIPVEDY